MSIKDISLPDLGEGVTEGELVKWLVSEGEHVQSDQVLAEIMTDKASMEVPSPMEGKVKSLLIKEGQTIQVGKSLLTLIVSNEESYDSESSSKKNLDIKKEDMLSDKLISQPAPFIPPPPVTSSPFSIKQPSVVQDKDGKRVLATPFTRRLAQERQVDLSQIVGSGLAGRVTKEDVLKHSKSSVVSQESLSTRNTQGFSIPIEDNQDRQPLKGIRKKIGQKMQQSKQVIPHFSLLESANVEKLDEMKNSVRDLLKDKPIKVTYLSFVMKALLNVIEEFPSLNASIDDVASEIVIKKYYNFGFAVDTPRGLLVPVIKDIDKKSLQEISMEIQLLSTRAREGKLQIDEMSGGTITITNIGSLGGEFATPIINPPEVAILGMYRLFIKPHWDGQSFQPQKSMNFSLTCDHRLIDGAVASRVLLSFIKKIENPLGLFI